MSQPTGYSRFPVVYFYTRSLDAANELLKQLEKTRTDGLPYTLEPLTDNAWRVGVPISLPFGEVLQILNFGRLRITEQTNRCFMFDFELPF